MGIINRLAKLVKAEVNYRIRKAGWDTDEDILSSDLEEELRHLEEELRQAEAAKQHGSSGPFRQEREQGRRQARPKNMAGTAYGVLGVAADASQKEIKDKYRELAKKYHPDKVHKLSPEMQAMARKKMKDINLAYDQIEDAKKRLAYDRSIGLL